jgi:hypothetical protein
MGSFISVSDQWIDRQFAKSAHERALAAVLRTADDIIPNSRLPLRGAVSRVN